MKIHIPSVSPDPINEPFNTIYGVTGTGLFLYKDLPGTFIELIKDYDLTHDANNAGSKFIVFSGTKKANTKSLVMAHVDEEIREYMEKSINYCRIWVSKKNGLIKAYSVGKSEKSTKMIAKIEYISVNHELPNDIFLYVPPEGVKAKDMTNIILKQNTKNKKSQDNLNSK